MIVCEDKNSFNLAAAKKILGRHIRSNYFWACREWPYKDVKPLVFAEMYLESSNSDGVADYKLYTFPNGRIITMVCTKRFTNEGVHFTYFDEDWNLLSLRDGNYPIDPDAQKPAHFDEMKYYARKLGNNLPHIRVDFFETRDKFYLGELTLYSSGGFDVFEPDEWNYRLGSWVDLEKATK